MHISIPIDQSCEFLNITPINPLISKCQIKVCYVGEDPNRNKSIITKEVARDMANSLPGCPIVGFYNRETADFESHNQGLQIRDGQLVIEDETIPYGFVDLNAKVWFQKFLDDGYIEREYLMTEGYIWTGQYPEASRIITKGNNQSMELDEKTLDATWTKDGNGEPQFFIINEAIISKLCILGENVEPCFEGAQIKVQFALDDDFQNKFVNMANELKEILSKGGASSMQFFSVELRDKFYSLLEEVFPAEENGSLYSLVGLYETEEVKFAVLKNKETGSLSTFNFTVSEESEIVYENTDLTDIAEDSLEIGAQFSLEDIVEYEKIRYAKKPEEEEEEEPPVDPEEEEDDDKKKKKYSLEEVTEYTELLSQHQELQTSYAALEEEVIALREFKANADLAAKQDMVNSFYMLSDEDKAEVVANIKNYSLEEIEAKLSIICVRNKVNFNLEEEVEDKGLMTYSLNQQDTDTAPAWVKAVRDNLK